MVLQLQSKRVIAFIWENHTFSFVTVTWGQLCACTTSFLPGVACFLVFTFEVQTGQNVQSRLYHVLKSRAGRHTCDLQPLEQHEQSRIYTITLNSQPFSEEIQEH